MHIEDLQAEREGLTKWCHVFKRNIDRLEDRAVLEQAGRQTFDDDPVFGLQGWAPKPLANRLREYAMEKRLVLKIEDPTPDETPPTLMHNPEALRVGENLVTFYMTPSSRLWDPSLTVLFSFSIFFAMIISDAGYGLVMALGLLLMRKKLAASPGGRKARTLMTFLTTATIIWGVAVGSYFGVSPAEGSFLGKLKFLDMQDSGFMMALSVIVGVIHLVIANAMDAWRLRESGAFLAPVGWIVVLLSGLVMAGKQMTIGSIGLVLGLLLVAVFTGAGAKPVSRVAKGLLALTKITNAFGDVMSYLRLFALGLASASLAMAFNDLASGVRESVPGFGILLGLIILVFGHTLNFALALVSGFVHGMRLNVIEFFNWGVASEGKPFRAFARRESVSR